MAVLNFSAFGRVPFIDMRTGTLTREAISALVTAEERIGGTTGGIPASEIVNTPNGDIAAVTVQSALDELDTEKASVVSLTAHTGSTSNPHSVTKTQVGLGSVDNTSDAAKPVSTAQATADAAVQAFAIQRVNHTGTQTAATVSDFATAADLRVKYFEQVAPTSKAAAATLTIAELLTGIIEYTGAVANLTLPTGADIEAGVTGMATDRAFEFSVINTGSGTATVLTAVGLTLVGAMTVPASTSGQFRVRRTAADTFTVYRVA